MPKYLVSAGIERDEMELPEDTEIDSVLTIDNKNWRVRKLITEEEPKA